MVDNLIVLDPRRDVPLKGRCLNHIGCRPYFIAVPMLPKGGFQNMMGLKVLKGVFLFIVVGTLAILALIQFLGDLNLIAVNPAGH